MWEALARHIAIFISTTAHLMAAIEKPISHLSSRDTAKQLTQGESSHEGISRGREESSSGSRWLLPRSAECQVRAHLERRRPAHPTPVTLSQGGAIRDYAASDLFGSPTQPLPACGLVHRHLLECASLCPETDVLRYRSCRRKTVAGCAVNIETAAEWCCWPNRA
jgi:hypothetical protein